MEIRTSQEARENIEKFTQRYLNLLQQKKTLDQDIKVLKEEFKEEGVPVAVVTKVINQIKADKKRSDSEIFEQDVIKEWLQTNKEIDDEIGMLNAK